MRNISVYINILIIFTQARGPCAAQNHSSYSRATLAGAYLAEA